MCAVPFDRGQLPGAGYRSSVGWLGQQGPRCRQHRQPRSGSQRSIPYWNAFVAVLEMHGQGSFSDSRLSDPSQFPVAARAGFDNVRDEPDLVSSKLPALHEYQLALAAPKAPRGSFNGAAAERGGKIFQMARCNSCHVAPTFSEPGWNLHTGQELGIDNFQANRAPARGYRTAPLRGLWTHLKGGF